MTREGFRRIALALPGASEGVHMAHPDFRVGRKIFASLGWPDGLWAMVKLSPQDQSLLVHAEPEAFTPSPGVWGRQGSTQVRLSAVSEPSLKNALEKAWAEAAPKHLAATRKP